MIRNIEDIVCIDIDVFNKLLLITGNTSDICLDSNKGKYLVEKSVYNKLTNEFNKILRIKERDAFLQTKGSSLVRFNELKDEYEKLKYNSIRDNYNKTNTKKLDEEELLDLEIKVYEEIDDIKQIPIYIDKIRKEINEVKDNKLSSNINAIELKFHRLELDGGLLDDYKKIKTELDLIIKKTYEDNINSSVFDDKGIYLVKNENEIRIMNSSNMNDFTYGFIYSVNSIKRVYDKDNDAFVSFDNLDLPSCKIEIKDEKPIAIYAVTNGEKSISPNYVKAQNLLARQSLPFIELDKTRLMSTSEYSINELIDNLIEDKGLTVSAKTEEFYNMFIPFYEKYMKIKLNRYDEGNIINLFDFYFNIIFSQKFLNLDVLLDKRYDIDIIKEILESNIYYDFNIFKNIKVNKTILKKFSSHFGSHMNNQILNSVYPGINIIINEINNSSDEKIEKIVSIINGSTCKDSWFISQLIKPTHAINHEEYINYATIQNSGPYIKEEEQVNKLVTLLKSQDEYAR